MRDSQGQFAGTLARAWRWVATPILVKELRATFRGWRFFAAHAGLLSLFALILLITLVVWMTETDPNPAMIGRVVFAMFIVFQGVLVALVLPAFGCTSVVGEKERKSFDLLLTTTLSPAEIVWGKFTATMAYSILFLVSTLPLVTVAFLFGGISLFDLGAAYLYLFVCSVLLNLYAVFISTTVKTSQRAVVACYLFLVPLVTALCFWAVGLSMRYVERIFEGRAAELTFEFENAVDFVLRAGLPGFGYLALLGFFFLSATNRLKAPTANHSTSFRVYYVVLVAGLAGMSIWVLEHGLREVSFDARRTACLIYLCVAGALGVFSMVFAAEDPVLPLRLRSQVSRMTGAWRFLRPFMPGSVNGALFCVGVNGLALAASVMPLWRGVLGPESFGGVGKNFEWVPTLASQGALAVPFTAACIVSFLVFLAGAGVLFSTVFKRSTTAKGMLGVLLLVSLLVPLIGWLVVELGREPETSRFYGMAILNLPLAVTSLWNGMGEGGIFEWQFHALGRDIPYAAVFCGLHVALGAGLFLWGLLRRRRLSRLAEVGPAILATSGVRA